MRSGAGTCVHGSHPRLSRPQNGCSGGSSSSEVRPRLRPWSPGRQRSGAAAASPNARCSPGKSRRRPFTRSNPCTPGRISQATMPWIRGSCNSRYSSPQQYTTCRRSTGVGGCMTACTISSSPDLLPPGKTGREYPARIVRLLHVGDLRTRETPEPRRHIENEVQGIRSV